MNVKFEKTERSLLIAIIALLLFAVLGPVVWQPVHQHDFADQRVLGGLPFAADVLSNLPFALWGVIGFFVVLYPKKSKINGGLNGGLRGLSAIFFAGLLATSAASSWYHLQPNNAGLVVDRLGMTLAFAGMLSLATADRVSHRAGVLLGGLAVVLGCASVWAWSASGNLLPWVVLQFGGMGLILWLSTCTPLPGALNVRWGIVILIYAVAKLFELTDHAVFDLMAHLVSGHSLKHIIASFAAWPVIAALNTTASTNRDKSIFIAPKQRQNLKLQASDCT